MIQNEMKDKRSLEEIKENKRNAKPGNKKKTKKGFINKTIERMLTYADESPRFVLKSQLAFFFIVINICIGLGNLTTFPGLAYKYGGGTFILSYIICLLIFGLPVLYLDMIIGQYHRCSPIVFYRRCAPFLQGIGWVTVIDTILLIFSYEYNVLQFIAFVTTSMFTGDPLSYSKCDNTWNDRDKCFEFFSDECVDQSNKYNYYNGICRNMSYVKEHGLQPAPAQFQIKLMRIYGTYNYTWFYLGALMWSLIALMHNRGLDAPSKFSIIPNIVIFIVYPFLLVRSTELPGWEAGVYEMITIDWDVFFTIELWIKSLEQVMFSISIGFGIHMTFASFAPPYSNSFRIIIVSILADTMFSIISTAIIFSTLGYMMTISGAATIYHVFPDAKVSTLTNNVFVILIKKLSSNHYLWFLLFYTVAIFMSWSTLLFFIIPITVTIADSWSISTKSYAYDLISVVCSLFFGISCSVFISDLLWTVIVAGQAQQTIQGIQIAIQLLTVVEVYGIGNIYHEIHVLMGRPVMRFWTKFGSSSPLWKLLWLIAPAIAVLNCLSVFNTDYISELPFDLDYGGFRILVLDKFLVVISTTLIPLFMFYSHMKMKEHFEINEKGKKYNWKIILKIQKQFRSWHRISRKMKKKDLKGFHENEKDLPDYEPDDLEGHWKLIYRQFFKAVKNEHGHKRKIGQKRIMSEREGQTAIGVNLHTLREQSPKVEPLMTPESITTEGIGSRNKIGESLSPVLPERVMSIRKERKTTPMQPSTLDIKATQTESNKSKNIAVSKRKENLKKRTPGRTMEDAKSTKESLRRTILSKRGRNSKRGNESTANSNNDAGKIRKKNVEKSGEPKKNKANAEDTGVEKTQGD